MTEVQILLSAVGVGALAVNIRTFARDARVNKRDDRGASVASLWVSPLPESRFTSAASLLVGALAFGLVGPSL